MKKLDLTVLAYEGPQARAYLARMQRAGLRAGRIVLIVQSTSPGSKKPVGRWLPGGLRRVYAEKVQERANNFWPRRIAAAHPELMATMSAELGRVFDGAGEVLGEMRGRFVYEDHADDVERVLAKGLGDDALTQALARHGPATILYTGGGILRANLLDLSGVRFLHIHPGYLPPVRGADGLLWSLLIRGRPGASCFYMEKDIDTGDIIAREDFPALAFPLPASRRPDDQTLYRALFSYYDPLMRAELLVTKVLAGGGDLSALETRPQGAGDGITYHFLHAAVRGKALGLVFPTVPE